MRVLIGCERSGVLRRRFAALGHDAVSVDLEPADDGALQGTHVIGDVFTTLRSGRWDLFIVHPPCTFLASSGLHWNLRRPERAQQTNDATDFAVACWEEGCRYADKVVVENPIGRLGPVMRERFGISPQIIQPHQFGDDASKATCLWLRGVPPLRPTASAAGRFVAVGVTDLFGDRPSARRFANQTDSGQSNVGEARGRAARRSQTYPGIADAMVDQWGSRR